MNGWEDIHEELLPLFASKMKPRVYLELGVWNGENIRRVALHCERAIGVAHEGSMAIGMGVEGDGLDVGTLLGAQGLHRSDAAHGGLAPVHDGQPANRTRPGMGH